MVAKKSIKKRARTKKGRFVGDNKKTPHVNEAYVPMMSVLSCYNDTMYRFGSLWGGDDA